MCPGWGGWSEEPLLRAVNGVLHYPSEFVSLFIIILFCFFICFLLYFEAASQGFAGSFLLFFLKKNIDNAKSLYAHLFCRPCPLWQGSDSSCAGLPSWSPGRRHPCSRRPAAPR
jgi:hypothetical protein